MRVSTAHRGLMTRGPSMVQVGTIVPFAVLSMKGGERDVRIRVELLHTMGCIGEDITVLSPWEGGSGG